MLLVGNNGSNNSANSKRTNLGANN